MLFVGSSSLFEGIIKLKKNPKAKRKSNAQNASTSKNKPASRPQPKINQMRSSSLNARPPLRIGLNRNPLRLIRIGELQPILLVLHFLQLRHHRRTRVHSLDQLDLFAFFERHDPARSGNNASARDEEPCRPGWSVVAVQAPHEAAQAGLEEGVPDVAPDVEVEFPEFGGWGADAG